MSEKTSMFELLNERMEKEDIVKLVCNYDDKFNELEEENKQLQTQLQQKENIIKEVKEKIESVRIFGLRSGKTLIATLLNDILGILDKENK